MKKLYRKGVVHPTTPPPLISDHLLYLLPATLLTLTAALSSQEREVLAYLISSNNHRSKFNKTSSVDHLPCFDCYCFSCYTTFWVKWDSSPNRELIHHIIDDFEDTLCNENTKQKPKNKKKNNKSSNHKGKGKTVENVVKVVKVVELDQVNKCEALEDSANAVGDETLEANNVEEEAEEMEKGSIRRFVSFVGERIWGVWG